jgi:tetratricopeptide (TPR) repeat protein
VHDEALAAARELFGNGQLELALARAQKAIEAVPESLEALSLKQEIERAMERRSAEEVRLRRRANELVREGELALKVGDADRSISLAEKALAIDPGNEAAAELLRLAEREKEHAEAAAKPPEPVEEAPETPSEGQAHYVVALAYWEAGDAAGTEEYAKKAIEADPGHEKARELLGMAVSARREAERAKASKPTQAGASQVEVQLAVAKSLLAAGAYDDARSAVLRALREDPNNAEALLLLQRIEREAAREEVGTAPPGPAAKAVEAPAPPPRPAEDEEERKVIAVLEELDRAFEIEDVSMLDRLISGNAGRGALSGGDVTREEEIENARRFFGVASGVELDRVTRAADVEVGALDAEARSAFRINYRIGDEPISRGYRALYRLALEGGAWRFTGVTIEAENP